VDKLVLWVQISSLREMNLLRLQIFVFGDNLIKWPEHIVLPNSVIPK